MKKVKVLTSVFEYDLEDRINSFIANHNVIDIQYRIAGKSSSFAIHSAMIIYEDPGDVKGE